MAVFALIFSSLVILSGLQGILAVKYSVTNAAANTPGGIRFVSDVGVEYSLQSMSISSQFIWSIFHQNSPSHRKAVQKVSLFIDDIDGVAYASNDEIHFSASYIQGYSGDLKREFTGVLYYVMARVWQWNGNGQAPEGLLEGIADFVRLKAGYVPSHWAGPGQGEQWDQGFDITARFLAYCNDLRAGFVAELNNKMKNGYSDGYFEELLGKKVDQLWKDYKSKYSVGK